MDPYKAMTELDRKIKRYDQLRRIINEGKIKVEITAAVPTPDGYLNEHFSVLDEDRLILMRAVMLIINETKQKKREKQREIFETLQAEFDKGPSLG